MKFPGCLKKWMMFAIGSFFATMALRGQSPLYIYTDNLANGFQDWSWATRNMENATPVHSGSDSISVTAGTTYQGISFHQNDFNTSLYTNLTFWANGGSTGGQQLGVYLSLDTNDQSGVTLLPLLPKNAWQQYTVSLASLGAANATNLSRLTIWMTSGSGTYYLDDIQLSPAAPPPLVHLSVNATNTLRQADARWFGLNTATWDGQLGNAQTLPMVEAAGIMSFRWPGGSTSDGYHWASDISGNDIFINLVTNAGVGTNCFVTVNYGSGTSNEAAAWVKFLNITNHCHIGNWEVGNECYGTWEEDNNNLPNDPYTYATRAAGYMALMRAADPTIKVGIVVVPGEDSSSNNATHYAINPRTGGIHYGWTPILFNTLSNLGVMPDFVIYHDYPQYTATGNAWEPNSPDSDPLLLQVADTPSTLWTDWASAAANLRQQITDYLGPRGTNIQLCVTENNSDAGAMGRQSTSVVNALYLADSLSQLMKTEFNSYVWWDLFNGSDTTGDFDPTLYGWRSNGDYGVLNAAEVPYPTYYAEKLLQSFVRPGDTILNAANDSLALSAYASRKADGSLAMLVINKTPTNVLSGQISLTNFTPASGGVMRSYGITQDEETRTNGPAAAQDIYTNAVSVASVFTNSFPPYSLTLFTFEPVASQMGVASVSAGQVVLSLQGQSGAPYVIESSTNLTSWNVVSTNMLSGSMVMVTNTVAPGLPGQYWRAVWVP